MNQQHQHYFDTVNYDNDFRNQPAPEHIITLFADDTGEEFDRDVELPTKWEVCSVCKGKGKHVNPSIDAGGISAEDFLDDPDFAEAYMDGSYDITCNRCHGRTTERVIDYDGMPKELQEAYDSQQRAEAECRAESAAERAMGA